MREGHERPGGSRAAPAPRSVLLAVPRWTRDGGVSAHVQASASLLAGHGVRVGVLTARVDPGELPAGVTLLRCPDLFDSGVALERRLADAASFDAEVVHLHQVDDPGISQWLGRESPVVHSVHVYMACTSGVYYYRPGHECARSHGPVCALNLSTRHCSPGYNLSSLPSKYRSTTRRLAALRRADLVVCYSTATDRHLAANGLARRRVIPYSATIAPALGSGHDTRRRVVFAGRIVATKGVGVLIDAAREVDAEFVICGEGRQLEAMRERARRNGVEQRCSFMGWLGPEQLSEQFAQASIVVVPSLWPEPFGLVGIEALAAGRPVVASATGGITDWLQDGVNGLAVAPGDAAALAGALNELLGDTERQRTMGLAGREMVATRFSAEHHLGALLDCYREVRAGWTGSRAGGRDAALTG